LSAIETEQRVAVLYAVESGSRAWGFASTNSDWDVRFVYLRPPEWYLSIQRRRDVIEQALPGDLDVSGWDLRKALGLFAKSNPPLLEWLRSPIVYRERADTVPALRELSRRFFSPRSCLHHYFHMAEGNDREYLHGPTVRLKKYFYVLRPVLACRWIERLGSMPPTEFACLAAETLPEELQPTVEALLARKRAGEELSAGAPIPELREFLGAEVARLRATLGRLPRAGLPDWEVLDAFFRQSLARVWDGTAGRPL